MPVTIKSSQVKVKGTDGYIGVDALADSTTASRISAINSAGASALEDIQSEGLSNVSAIEQKGAEVLESIPDEYTQLENNVSELKSALNTKAGYGAVGFNVWDEEWEVVNGNHIKSKNYIPVMPNTQYYFKTPVNPGYGFKFYDSNKTLLSTIYSTGLITTPDNCEYVTFEIGLAYGAQYNHDICLNLRQPNFNISPHDGDYVPYKTPTLYEEFLRDRGVQNLALEGAVFTISTAGNGYVKYNIVSGKTYTVENHSGVMVSVRTIGTPTGDAIQTVSQGLAANAKVTFTASDNANYLAIYSSSVPNGSIIIYDSDTLIPKMADKIEQNIANIEVLETLANKLENESVIQVTTHGSAFQTFAIQSGHAYTIENNSNQIWSIASMIRNTDTVVQTISEGLYGNNSLMFIATGDADCIRYYTSRTPVSGEMKIYENSTVLAHDYRYFHNKKIVTLGDSIFGNNATAGTGVGDYISRITGANVTNAAFGGTRMVKRSANIADRGAALDFENLVDAITSGDYSAQETSIETYEYLPYFSDRLNTLKNIDFSNVDIVTLNYGTNDWEAAVNLDTYRTVYEEAVKKLLTAYPKIQVFLVTTAFRFWIDSNNNITDDSNTRKIGSVNLPEFNVNIYKVGENLSIPVIDAYNIGINRETVWTYFATYDTTHHIITGRQFLGECLGRQLLANVTGKQVNVLPTVPELDGTYVLRVTIQNGKPTYAWVSV